MIEQHPALLERPHRLDSSAWVSARLAELLPLPLEAKQALLETDDGRARLEKLDALVSDSVDSGAKQGVVAAVAA